MKNKTTIKKRLLEDFVFNNREFEILESKLKEFNIFKILGIVDFEIRHSNFLAWLLNPDENHGLGNYFLKKFFSSFLYYNNDNSLSLIELEELKFNNVKISREWRKIDLLIELVEDNKKLLFIIENKIWSTPHNNQLKRYPVIIEKHYNTEYLKYYIYLTPNENINDKEIIEQPWIIYNYSNISNTLTLLLDFHKENMNPQVYSIIDDYNKILKRYIVMKDEEITNLSKVIWQNHKEAIEILIKHRPNLINEFTELFFERLQKENINKNRNIEFKTEELNRLSKFISLYYYIVRKENELIIRLYIKKNKNIELAQKIFNSLTTNSKIKSLRNDVVLTDEYNEKLLYAKTLVKVNNPLSTISELDVSTIKFFDEMCEEFISDIKEIELSLEKIEL